MLAWLRNVWLAVTTVAHGLWVTLRCWFVTYRIGPRNVHREIRVPGEAGTRVSPAIGGFTGST